MEQRPRIPADVSAAMAGYLRENRTSWPVAFLVIGFFVLLPCLILGTNAAFSQDWRDHLSGHSRQTTGSVTAVEEDGGGFFRCGRGQGPSDRVDLAYADGSHGWTFDCNTDYVVGDPVTGHVVPSGRMFERSRIEELWIAGAVGVVLGLIMLGVVWFARRTERRQAEVLRAGWGPARATRVLIGKPRRNYLTFVRLQADGSWGKEEAIKVAPILGPEQPARMTGWLWTDLDPAAKKNVLMCVTPDHGPTRWFVRSS